MRCQKRVLVDGAPPLMCGRRSLHSGAKRLRLYTVISLGAAALPFSNPPNLSAHKAAPQYSVMAKPARFVARR
jgi:hypothetical protein